MVSGPGRAERILRASISGSMSRRRRVLLAQAPLAVTVATLLVLVAIGYPETILRDRLFLAGVTGIGVLTLAAGVAPWGRMPRGASWSIPLLDFLPVAALAVSAGPGLDGTSMLVAFPVIWLAWSGMHRWAVIAASFVGALVPTYVVTLAQPGPLELQDWLRPAVVPVLMVALAVISGVLQDRIRSQSAALERSLHDARLQFRTLETTLDAADVGIVVVDADGHDLLMNAAQRTIHTLCLPEGLDDGPEAQLLLFEEDGRTPIPVADRPVARALAGFEVQGRIFKAGTGPNQKVISVSTRTVSAENGDRAGTVAVFHDVTEMMEAIAARERFVADVSHELRTPLTSIMAFTTLAQEELTHEGTADDVRHYLTVVDRNAERLLALVEELLDRAAGRAELQLTSVNISRSVRHALESAAVRARSAGIELVRSVRPDVVAVADPVKIGQVMDNLLSNAIKYTRSGGTITVSLTVDGSDAVVTVADTGIGMAGQELKQLYRSFYRTEYVRRSSIPGVGLGLAITRALVRAHGGEISAESARGVGSTFSVRLPLAGPQGEDAVVESAVTDPAVAWRPGH